MVQAQCLTDAVLTCVQDAASGDTLLHGAVRGADDLPEFVSALIAAGVPASAANREHADTPLHIAARLGHIGVGLLSSSSGWLAGVLLSGRRVSR